VALPMIAGVALTDHILAQWCAPRATPYAYAGLGVPPHDPSRREV